MKNKELFANVLIDLVLSGAAVAVNKHTNEPVSCEDCNCEDCLFWKETCESEKFKSWADEDATSFWANVEIDTPILVREAESDEWLRRHFAYYSYRDRKVYAYVGGKSSYTSKVPPCGWKQAKIFAKGMEE